ncbi:MAG TPA: tRNA (adenosine(37)-N6)-threonylcarbamoyltransferase complex ATPase subunit type 1 TsaE [Gammaproteobacteria bacterium]|jgi:tRNA threonylcarbamoyladenosine biosynthesis protein TsaE|nr:tRNA (adenosine(37)-N6)-threonylcarbamoyltransferase complex ATPase subunit type 1 TsaE [Gammaproteobacteria bacterium]HAT28821.1 tRNA (adenosine(37)-N6)-threonylcarbamoyltransferase complex ATPase subunit type 1 TsaE [Gammaproteobacteria bacterium]HIF86665.1 tRNA (adenosine(37)-N6)-threonylcarbamoyltransferase complex ATPase subunit type 1 TsaE [Gammaproteobacteria bacterium]HIL62876.1 tRNA (adenosine(37)-N6)-threonylcarbamoyltransferase complex ATPase subunit type 1 TsaE [Porticoccaceae bac|tara:strand:- start:7147 stop:7704 length:558 start_codon:yes stop_codon:yes gene_type:complete
MTLFRGAQVVSNKKLHIKDESAMLLFGAQLAQATFADAATSLAEVCTGQGVPTMGGTLHLHGDLGAGKTSLTRGILRGYGYPGAVKSPSFTLVEPYEFKHCKLYHFDFYRLDDPEEVEFLGVGDYFSPENLCIVEWAERGIGAIPPPDLRVDIEIEGTGRLLGCQSNSKKGEAIAKRLWASGRNL